MKLEWVKSIPGYQEYFNKDHQIIISLIGIDNYLKLYESFGKTGIYFSSTNNDRHLVTELIGEENFQKLYNAFDRAGIYFGSSAITKLKKAYAVINRHIAYNEAARKLEVSIKTIYNWREENNFNNQLKEN